VGLLSFGGRRRHRLGGFAALGRWIGDLSQLAAGLRSFGCFDLEELVLVIEWQQLMLRVKKVMMAPH